VFGAHADVAVPGEPETAPLGGHTDDLNELEAVILEREELRAVAQRLQADFENYRKRSMRNAGELADRKVISLLSALLPAVDAIGLAIQHTESDGAPSTEGEALIQVRSLLLDELSKQGLEPLGVAGEVFDPEHHDAVMHLPGVAPAIVTEVFREGYTWQGKVIRPAMVKVEG